MIGNYWNSAWRNLMKRKRFSFIRTGDWYGIGTADSYLRDF